ncbi:uncharacterized protein LOC142335912 [Convolutriloba macropyga]|uniref:uncharacterized protein LOC142335912 n=1 Tax=Convolutriloba macropyga TaxID=536237 RepID=UPI003F522A3C
MLPNFLELLLLSALICCGSRAAIGAKKNPWWSLQFYIATNDGREGEDCLLNQNDFYCLSGFMTDSYINRSNSGSVNRARPRLTRDSQGARFNQLINNKGWGGSGLSMTIRFKESLWKMLNWVQLYAGQKKEGEEIERCCQMQLEKYYKYGLRFGYTSEEYLEQLINVADDGRVLNYVEARFVNTLCLNIITYVGFGSKTEHLKIKSPWNKQNMDYALAVRNQGEKGSNTSNQIFKIKEVNLQRDLTFALFKKHFICRGQQWLCMNY